MSKRSIDPSDLGVYIAESLTFYHRDVIEKVNAAGEEAAKALVRKTKATAPKRSGAFRKAITYTEKYNGLSDFYDKKFIWGAKTPHHRLTHLLVKGHAKATGGRVEGDPFLKNALDEVLPDYEQKIKEALTE